MDRQDDQACPGRDLWEAYREVMARPLSADELQGFGKRKESKPSVAPYADVKLVNRRGRKGISVTIGLKGTF